MVTIGGLPVYDALVMDDDCGMVKISLVDDPAVMSDFQAFDNARRMQTYSVMDEEKRLVRGVVMRADFPIYRRDERLGEYYIIYKAETIRRMAEKYLADGLQNEVSTMHSTDVDGVQMVQYFIKGDGVSVTGFDDIADGSLFAEFHVLNDEVWEAVKDGTYKGFSLEGYFDLAPERDTHTVEEIVDDLDGQFCLAYRNFIHNCKNMSKINRFKAALAKLLAAFGNVSTDKGVIAWDGDEDLKEGDAVYIEDADGNRETAPDGDYVTTDAKTIVVADGKVAEIRDPEAEVAPEPAQEETAQEPEQKFGRIATDNGELLWEGEADLEAGREVFVERDGELVPAPDGEYKTEDGKTIVVADGKVAEIRDPEAEVAPEAPAQEPEQKFGRIATDNGELLWEGEGDLEAGREVFVERDGELVPAPDGEYKTEDGKTIVVVEGRVAEIRDPEAEVAPEPEPAVDEEKAALRAENAELRAQVETLTARVAELSRMPAAKPAHEEVKETETKLRRTGNKGLDRIAALMEK